MPNARPRPDRLVPCPTCRQPTEFSGRNAWRPFCSERCRNVDLGAWASEQFRVPAVAPPDSAADDRENGVVHSDGTRPRH